jgi:hypothetical protein
VAGFNCTRHEEALLARVRRDVTAFRGEFTTYDGAAAARPPAQQI